MTWTRIIELMMLSGHVAAVMARPREAPPALLPQWPRRAGVRQSPTRGSVPLWSSDGLTPHCWGLLAIRVTFFQMAAC